MNTILRHGFLGMMVFLFMFAVSAEAAAPTGASAVMNNTTATTVDVVITGTDFDQFVNAQDATAGALDLAGITYQTANPTSATIDNATTITATFDIADIGTDKSGSLVIDAGIVEDAADAPNLEITIVDGDITDSAAPVIIQLSAEDTDNNGLIDKLTYTWSENVDTDDGVAPVAGDLPATTLPGRYDAVFTAATITDPAGASADVVVTGVTGQIGINTEVTSVSVALSGDLSAKWVDAATVPNAADATVSTAGETIVDLAKPMIKTVTIEDTDDDGLIDKITYTWSEPIDTDNSAAPVAADLPTTLLPDGETAVFTAATITDPAGASADVVVTGITGQVTENTGTGSVAVSGDLSAKWVDVATTPNAPHATGGTANETVVDSAAPIVVSVDPTNGTTGQDANIPAKIIFSEPMDTSSIDFSTSTGYTYTATWSNSDKTVDLSPSTSYGPGVTVTASLNTIDDVASSANSLSSVYSWSFTTDATTSGGGGGGGSSKKVDDDDEETESSTPSSGSNMVGGLNIQEIFQLQDAGFTTAEINMMFGLQSQTQTSASVGSVLPIRPWTTGDATRAWQSALRNAGFDPGPIDGLWGPRTEAAVRAFQSAQGLSVDGWPGTNTAARMNSL